MAEEKYFYSEHRPLLIDGNYKIEVTPAFIVDDDNLFTRPYSLEFEVAGEQYSLNPQVINSVFPPAAGMGEYSDVLPHLILERSTLPWERAANENETKDANGKETKEGAPWLALLLYPESDALKLLVSQVPLKDFDNTSDSNDLISVISAVQPSDFKALLPSLDELSCLTHVRGEKIGNEKAVIICNHPPVKGNKNTIHLVSVEKCYDDNGDFILSKNKLVSLYSWSFFCTEHFRFTGGVLDLLRNKTAVNGNVILDDTLYNYLNDNYRDQEFFSWAEFMKTVNDQGVKNSFEQNKCTLLQYFDLGHLSNILKHLNRNSLKTSADKTGTVSDAILNAGYIVVPYTSKEGKQIQACYRGPLLSFDAKSTKPGIFELARNSDQHFRTIDSGNSKHLDITYASAWELGRLLCLQNKNVSQALFQWKRRYYQLQKGMGNSDDHVHLPLDNNKVMAGLPPIVEKYIGDLINVKGIPFNYLIADEQMLPFESIRFFCIDIIWLKCLVDGFFSLGRVLPGDLERDKIIWTNHLENLFPENYSGFFLRSMAVSGWPDLVIEPGGDKPATRRTEILSRDVLLCLFDDVTDKTTIHQRPEILHFDISDKNSSNNIISFDKGKITFPDTKIKSSVIATSLIAQLEKIIFQAGANK